MGAAYNLSAFIYRLFHEDLSSIIETNKYMFQWLKKKIFMKQSVDLNNIASASVNAESLCIPISQIQ